MLKIDKIDVFYGQVQILREVSFEVEAGKIICLLGSNGAGKTTTVRSISGILPVASGSIQFMGEDMNPVPAHRRA